MGAADELLKRGDELFTLQSPLLPLWQEIAWQFYPERASFTQELCLGEEYASHLFDEGPVVMRRDLGNSFAVMLRPRGQDWFKPELVDEELRDAEGVADWLDDAKGIMRRFMYASGTKFVRETNVADHDFATFGNAVLSVEENDRRNGIVFTSYHLRDCAWAENAAGMVDVVHRKFKWTARQIKQRWGKKAKLHKSIVDACEKAPETKFELRHVMLPMEDYEYLGEVKGKLKRFPFASIYIDERNKEIISTEGAYEFRYIVPRWQIISGTPYALSPATSDSLPGVRSHQLIARTGLSALEKSVDPPAKVTEGAIRGELNLGPAGLTWVDKDYDERLGPSLELLDVGKNAILGLQSLDASRMKIADSMYVSKLNLPQNNAKTAYETQQLVEEYVRAAVPLFEPVEENYNVPLLEAVWTLLFRMGAFGPMEDVPEALRGQEIRWSFQNPLQNAMERVKFQTFQNVVMTVQAASQLDPQAGDVVDVVEATRDTIRGLGSPEAWVLDQGEVEARAEQRQEMQQMMQAAQMAEQVGASAGAAAEGALKVNEAVNAFG